MCKVKKWKKEKGKRLQSYLIKNSSRRQLTVMFSVICLTELLDYNWLISFCFTCKTTCHWRSYVQEIDLFLYLVTNWTNTLYFKTASDLWTCGIETTDHVRSTREGNVFRDVCLSPGLRGLLPACPTPTPQKDHARRTSGRTGQEGEPLSRSDLARSATSSLEWSTRIGGGGGDVVSIAS